MSKQFDAQRLRNLTTGRLHTKMEDCYKDLEWLCGESGLMTHMLPNMLDAAAPWLRQHVTDSKYWDGIYDPFHVGTYTLPTPAAVERDQMWNLYRSLPRPRSRVQL